MRGVLLALSLLLGSCVVDDAPWKQVTPLHERSDNPCYRVGLLDGLAMDSPDELHDLYRCLNLRGGFEGARGVVETLVTTEDTLGRSTAQDAAIVINRLPGEFDLVEGLRTATDLLQERDEFLLHVVHVIAEWTWGRPWPEIEAAFAGPPTDNPFLTPASVQDGLVAPLVWLLSSSAREILASGDLGEMAANLEQVATMPELADSLDTLSRLVQDQEADLMGHVAEDFGVFLQEAVTPQGEDTLVETVEALMEPRDALGGRSTLVSMLEPADELLSDPVAEDRIVAALGDLYDAQHLQPLPEQLYQLLTIDAEGVGIGPSGGTTAFEHLFLLLDKADQPVSCVGGLVIETDSLARWILEQVADFDASTVQSAVQMSENLVGTMLGVGQWACTGIDPDLTQHWPSMVRLAETGAMQTFVPLLAAIKNDAQPQHNRMQEVVRILRALHTGDTVDELSALGLRELQQPFMGNVLRIVGAYVRPTDPQAAADIHTLLGVARFLIHPPAGEGHERSHIGIIEPVLRAVLAEHRPLIEAWLQRWAVLLIWPGSESNVFLDQLAPLLTIDPELDTLAAAGRILGDTGVSEPLWMMLEQPAVAEALAASTNGDAGHEGLLGMIARFSADGSLEAVLHLLRWGADTLDEIGVLVE